MLEQQIKELSIKKENCNNKLKLSRLFWNMFFMQYDIYVDVSFLLSKTKLSVLAIWLQCYKYNKQTQRN